MKRSSGATSKTFRTKAVIDECLASAPAGFALSKNLTSVLASLVSVCVLAACSPSSNGNSTTYQLPWADDDGNYSLQKVEVKTFSHPSDLSGQYGDVLVHPHDDENKQLVNTKAAGHFIKAGGVAIAADVLSLQAATIYAHIERLHELDTMTGAVDAVQWPLKFGLDVKTTDGVKSNALYDPKRNAVVVMPYDAGRLPISINGGILAHEHFHTIFQALVIKGLPALTQNPTPGLMEAEAPKVELHGKSEWSAESLQTSEEIAKRLEQIQVQIQAQVSTQNFDGDSTDDSTNDSTDNSVNRTANGSAGDSSSSPPPKFFTNKPFVEIPIATYNGFLIHGINEGLADFYAWVYGGDPTFIENSLPLGAVAFRMMNVRSRPMPAVEVWQALLRAPGDPSTVASTQFQLGEAYVLGTYYSTFLRELAIRMSHPEVEAEQDTLEDQATRNGSDAVARAGADADAAVDSPTPKLDPSKLRTFSQVVRKDQRRTNAQLPSTSPRSARALSGVSTSAIAGRAAVANALIAALPDLQKALKANYRSAYLNPVVVVAPLFSHLRNVNSSMCDLAKAFISKTALEGSSSALKQSPNGIFESTLAAENLMPSVCAGLTSPVIVKPPVGKSPAPTTPATPATPSSEVSSETPVQVPKSGV